METSTTLGHDPVSSQLKVNTTPVNWGVVNIECNKNKSLNNLSIELYNVQTVSSLWTLSATLNVAIGATKKGTRGGPGPPNKEQNWENKEQNGGKKFQNGAFLGYGNS